MYKIVDTFNGYESRTYQKKADAESQLTADMQAFYAHPGHQDVRFCRVVMPSTVTWQWSERAHRFVWA